MHGIVEELNLEPTELQESVFGVLTRPTSLFYARD